MQKAKIYIKLKETVSDPQGLTIKHALESLGYDSAKEVRVGKLIILKIDSDNAEEAKQKVDEMCQKLLANPVIEEYSFELELLD